MLYQSLAVLGLVAAPAFAQETVVHYHVVDLGQVAGESSFFANAVNASGEAAGFFFGTDGTYNAFRYTQGSVLDISPPGDNLAFARGINDAGWVVGWTDFFDPQHGFLHDGRSLIDLGTLGGTFSDANDINNAGQIVGCASISPLFNESHAAIWEDGAWTDLGTLGGVFSEAEAINASGMIVGWSWNAAWDAKAVYWTSDLSGPIELPTFSTLERFTYASALNDDGVIVGKIEMEPFENQPAWRAVRWVDGVVEDLGLLPEVGQGANQYLLSPHTSTAARGINGDGVIIGMSFPASDDPLRPGPFVYRDDLMINLNDLLVDAAWIITDVTDINDTGVIAGTARLGAGQPYRAVLLVPVETLRGDLNNDGAVGFDDFITLLAAWGPCLGCPADLDHNGSVGFNDLAVLLANWS